MMEKSINPDNTKINGWLNIDKPYGVSSFDVVRRVRKALNIKKVGHAGTLDPLASGVLPIAIGEATKTISYIMDAKKTYQFYVTWGSSTTTDDEEGEVLETSDVRPKERDILAALPKFQGKIKQKPPIYSAIKINGQRAYKRARNNEDFEIKEREVEIYSLSLDESDSDGALFTACCSKGTYIRALGRDLAEYLKTKGHIGKLIRKKVGVFSLSSAILLDNLDKLVHNAQLYKKLLPVEAVLDDILVLSLGHDLARDFRNGKVIQNKANLPVDSLVSVYLDSQFFALGHVTKNGIKPKRVFNI